MKIGIIGGGFIGYLCGLWIKRIIPHSHVSIIEKQNNIGDIQSASYGCAGSFATYAMIPINNSSILTSFPYHLGLINKNTQPLTIKWKEIHKMKEWLFRFLINCNPTKVNNIIRSLGYLTKDSLIYYEPFLSQIENKYKNNKYKLINTPNGCIYLHLSNKSYNKGINTTNNRIKYGSIIQELSKYETLEIEPELNKYSFYCSQLLSPTKYTTNPQLLLSELDNIFQNYDNTNVLLGTDINNIQIQSNSISLNDSNNNTYDFDNIVIASGTYSNSLLHLINDYSIPLATERGYHVMLHNPNNEIPLLSHIVGSNEKGIYITPMNKGIRIAGLVELGGDIYAEPTQSNFDYLIKTANEIYPPSKNMVCTSKWLGFRPTLPDSLPVIGKSSIDSRILYAFGHQHIGLTLAGITGNIIAKILNEDKLDKRINDYSPNRFQDNIYLFKSYLK